MKRALRLFGGLIALCLCLFCGTAAIAAEEAIASRSAEVDGLKVHYLTAGHGPAVILLHGYTQTSRMWRPLIPSLAEKFTVIAPDLPGIGDSEIPKDGLDMKTSAIRIHALAKSLGVKKARVVGHDIGLMVAYAYAAQFPAEVEKLVLMDAFLPGVAGWEAVYNNPNIWHFRFNGPTPEALVEGREKIYFAYFWNDLAADKNAVSSNSGPRSLCCCLFRAGKNARGLGVFCRLAADSQGLRNIGPSEANDPGPVDRRRKIIGRRTGAASEAGCHGRHGDRIEGRRTLDNGRAACRDDGCAFEISIETQLPKRANAVRSGNEATDYFFCSLLLASFTAASSASADFTFTSGSTPTSDQSLVEYGLMALTSGMPMPK